MEGEEGENLINHMSNLRIIFFNVASIKSMLVDVLNHKVIDEIFNGKISAYEASCQGRGDIVGNPICYNCYIATIFT